MLSGLTIDYIVPTKVKIILKKKKLVMLTLSNMRSINSVQFKTLLGVRDGIITSINTDSAFIRIFNN